MNFRSLALSSLSAGVIMGILSGLPIIRFGNCLACLWLWSVPIFGVWLYIRLTGKGISMTSGQGAIIGALSGLLGAFIMLPLSALFGEAAMAALSQSAAADYIPGLAILGAGIGFLVNIFVFPFFGAIGGAIGVQLFGKPHSTPFIEREEKLD